MVDHSALPSEIMRFSLMAHSQKDCIFFLFIFLHIKHCLFKERFLHYFQLVPLKHPFLNFGLQIIKVFIKTGCLRVPVSDKEVGDGFERGESWTVKSSQSMTDEVENTLKTVLRTQKKGFFVGGEGEYEVEIGGNDNFWFAPDVLFSVLKFGMAVLDMDVVFVIVGLVPVES